MSTFNTRHHGAAHSGSTPATERPYSELSPDEIDHLVKRGHALRAAYVSEASHRFFQSWMSVLRRPGRLYNPQTAR